MVTLGSLFSGIGGLEIGLGEALGAHPIWQVENDRHARTILDRHWPLVPTYGDITEVDFKELEPPDILCGGFPCQDISAAGLKAGIEGAKSGLWSEFRRSIRVLRPPIVVVENVSTLLVRGFDVIASDLAMLGYDMRWSCLRSADVGAPHRRERLFIVAHPDEPAVGEHTRKTLAGESRIGRRSIDHGSSGLNENQPDNENWDYGRYTEAIDRWAAIHGPPPAPKDERGRLNPRFVEWMMGFATGWVEGIPYTAQLRCLGNAVQPQVAALIGAQQW